MLGDEDWLEENVFQGNFWIHYENVAFLLCVLISNALEKRIDIIDIGDIFK